MKHRSAFKEAFETKAGFTCFIVSTIALVAYIVLLKVLPADMNNRMLILTGVSIVIIGGGVMFSQILGAIQNDIDKEEKEAAKAVKHIKKKK